MKLDFYGIKGGLSITESPNCKILRCIYQCSFPRYCLIRIYEFKTKTIVIASQLKGPVNWNYLLIYKVIKNFKLNINNLLWINHVGLFSDYKPVEEKFIHTLFSWSKTLLFSDEECHLIEEKQITLQAVEELIESQLESVETWLGLKPKLQEEKDKEHQEKLQKLLHFYLQDNLSFLAKQKEIQVLLPEASVGAIFFYPEKKARNETYIKFLKYADLDKSNDETARVAMPYVEKYYSSEEIVVCVCTDDAHTYCSILSKNSLLNIRD